MNLVTGQTTGTEAVRNNLFPFYYHLSSLLSQAIQLAYLYERENEPDM